MEIFEQYFYDLNQQARIPGNEYVYSDVDDMLEEKLQIFEKEDAAAVTILAYTPFPVGFFELPDYIYRVNKIQSGNTDCEIMKTKDFNDCVNGGPLTRPNNNRPIANLRGNVMRVIGGTAITPTTPITPTSLIYFKKPGGINSSGTNPDVAWGYFVVGGKALYDTSTNKTFHFELHS